MIQLDSFYSLIFSTNATAARKDLVEIGRLQEWLTGDGRAQYGNEYITNSTRELWKATIRAQGGLKAPLKWYRAFLEGINSGNEKGENQTPL
jgi:soluble epoxide hydrolase/lipid-phosphate phosphatase